MKSIQDWLQELPDGYRELALANLEKVPANKPLMATTLSAAVIQFIDWRETNEGTAFWLKISCYLDGEVEELPPLPSLIVQNAIIELEKKVAELARSNKSLANSLDKRYMDNCIAGHAIEDALESVRINMRPDTFFRLQEKIAKVIKSLSN